jgi:hypothetical protein
MAECSRKPQITFISVFDAPPLSECEKKCSNGAIHLRHTGKQWTTDHMPPKISISAHLFPTKAHCWLRYVYAMNL